MSRTRVLVAAALALSLAVSALADIAVQRPQDKVQKLRITHSLIIDPTATVSMPATGTEINNACDISGQLQAIVAAGAVTVDGTKRRATLSGGAYAITLAVPGAAAIGAILVIEYTGGDTDAVTLALTNVIGESGGTTATFNADGEGLVLIGTALGWVVLKEFGGVTLA